MSQADPHLHVRTTSADHRSRVVAVRGDIDLVTLPAFTTALLDAADIPGGGRVLVDLNEVTFVGAAGIDALAEARERARAAGTALYTAAAPDTLAGRLLDRAGRPHDPDVPVPGDTRPLAGPPEVLDPTNEPTG